MQTAGLSNACAARPLFSPTPQGTESDDGGDWGGGGDRPLASADEAGSGSGSTQQPPRRALPSRLEPGQYAEPAFAAAAAAAAAGSQLGALPRLAPARLPAAMAAEAARAPSGAALRALQSGLVPPAALPLLPAGAHAALLGAWAKEDPFGAAEHANSCWPHVTEEHVSRASVFCH